ncbi:hypothetical protein BN946_scf184657.g42 [Trametes cinnabarina]|uniref:Fungal-type protein kinase domain-containing protein n=1 Tax=Pycnoporus cinnabarinus TaxID=5643 RepID=A0A060SSL6_PYCCI|nr:hypothetical protein BN946_scf184657.g42 [Trametes cinnabarina]
MPAHKRAVENADIMHREISGGNILILPKDGIWQFKSAAVLSDHGKINENSDELEPFFHVNLYYAVRYLRSNCSDVGAFIDGFFKTYTVEQDIYKCGGKKSAAMKFGLLAINTESTPLEFSIRLDGFFKQALQWHKAHTQFKPMSAVSARSLKNLIWSQLSSMLNRRASSRIEVTDNLPEEYAWAFEEFAVLNEETKTTVPKPSAERFNDAAKVATHDPFLGVAMAVKTWPHDRVEGDNVPASYKPQTPIGPPLSGDLNTVKRRKTEAQTCGSSKLSHKIPDLHFCPCLPRRLLVQVRRAQWLAIARSTLPFSPYADPHNAQ